MQLPIRLDFLSAKTLQAQIVEQMCELIRAGQLPLDSPVPSSRELSEQLHVSRNTVVEAYELLIDEGYLYTQRAVGTFVSKTLPEDSIWVGTRDLLYRNPSRRRAINLPLPYAARGLPGLHKPADPALPYDFALGRTDAGSFPEKVWRRLILDCLGEAPRRMSEYGDPAGLWELRELITSFIGPARGMAVAPEQILIVAGCQHGLSLAAHLFVATNTTVVVESPCYRGAVFLFEGYGGKIIPVPVDEEGIDVNRLPERDVKLVYVTPSHQFPTGVTMSLDRRIHLLEWAARAGAYILEVDYDADFRYDDSPLPSLHALDENGVVIYMSSFSHSIGPGLRLGYMVVPRDLIAAARTIKGLSDNGLPWLEQAALAQFIREGGLINHLRRLRHTYKGRRDALVGALRRQFGTVDLSGAEAGMHLLWRLPHGVPPACEIQRAARSHGVGVYPIQDSPAYYYEHMKDHERILLLGYTPLSEAQIEDGVARLAAAASR